MLGNTPNLDMMRAVPPTAVVRGRHGRVYAEGLEVRTDGASIDL